MNRFITVVLSIWFVSVAAIASAQTLRVIADRTNVRDKASTDGAIVVAVSKGDELEVLDRSGAWYHVRVKSTGAQGYVNAAVVEVVPGGTPNAATPAPAAPPSNAPAPAAPRAATQSKASSSGSTGGDRKVFIRPFGGLWSGYSATGFGGGVGVALRPFSIPELELEIDGAYAHQSLDAFVYLGTDYSWSANLIQGSGNVLYNFKLPNSSFTPFAGGGLQYSHETFSYPSGLPGVVFPDYGFNGIGFQVIGGVEKPINDSMAWRFQFRAGNGLMVLAGVSF
jgi:Bacterial SH3 domain